MKKCPFCAEKIRDEAIKCRYCGSFLSAAPPGAGDGGGGGEDDDPKKAAREAKKAKKAEKARARAEAKEEKARARDKDDHKDKFDGGDGASPGTGAGDKIVVSGEIASASGGRAPAPRVHEVLYSGAPLWRAYFRAYLLATVALVGLPVGGYFAAASWAENQPSVTALAIGVPLAVAALAMLILHWRRRSKRIRITTHNIEREYGVLGRRIDVLELWRCRDVRYRQSLSDRILRIAHLEIYTSDVTAPHFVIVGMPSSRELFESIRDAIEDERQSHLRWRD